jgi:tRNA (mo5U34)-methyltransferase
MNAAERIAEHRWWHTIEVAPGIVTPGGWDLRSTSAQLPWPDVSGKRCLDIGTMDGFWAFELERRGAAEVLATDIGPAHSDVPARRTAQGPAEPRARSVAATCCCSTP